ncbi:hypothetical protein SAMN06295960_2322 [Paenibacillus aquistagni]|uniref:Uncharacterized protein n=1 Tax=Paenibacillus aquistagni TaxID=1852522 RepID=A0A1X7KCP4_9BACL|nr:hypothetical protein SAMN06295960_2322 [Paenibacillus aquistagni]
MLGIDIVQINPHSYFHDEVEVAIVKSNAPEAGRA